MLTDDQLAKMDAARAKIVEAMALFVDAGDPDLQRWAGLLITAVDEHVQKLKDAP